MSEEKKNLTEEERKELKENLKKKIDEMSDEELDKVTGGFKYFEYKCEKCGATLSAFEDHKCREYEQKTGLSDPSLENAN